MGYCDKKKKRKWKDMQIEWERDLQIEEMQNSKFWEYDFDDNEEWTLGDYEQSPLAQIILGRVFAYNLQGDFDYEINRYYSILKSKNNKDKKIRLLYDVMNNPKYNTEGKNEYKYRRIGNFVPLPGKTLQRSLQFIHRDKGERWDEFLYYLRKNWKEVNDNSDFSFPDYMKASCQQMYYKEVYDKFIDRKDNCLKLLESKEDRDIKKFFDSINKIVDDLEENEKVGVWDGNKEIEFICLNDVERIKFLIELRGKMIMKQYFCSMGCGTNEE